MTVVPAIESAETEGDVISVSNVGSRERGRLFGRLGEAIMKLVGRVCRDNSGQSLYGSTRLPSTVMVTSRRKTLLAIGGLGMTGLGGCLGETRTADDESEDRVGEVIDGIEPPGEGPTPDGKWDDDPPVASERYHLPWDVEELDTRMLAAVRQDSIPSIDHPEFGDPEETELNPGDPVFGVLKNGVAKAYSQRILVHHEIVNDRIGELPVSVTYCPLTGTAQGFERGGTEFGVSGRLLNSNLVMYNREFGGLWPQILGTSIEGPARGFSLPEFRVHWTTWGEWRAAFPETGVLLPEADTLRPYGLDSYGSYNPVEGYYEDENIIWPRLISDDDLEHPKTVVFGGRTDSAAIAFRKESIMEAGLLMGPLGDEQAICVKDPTLSTGYIYRNPEQRTVEQTAEGYAVGDTTYRAGDLPLEPVLTMDAMWFAWYGFYPTTTYIR